MGLVTPQMKIDRAVKIVTDFVKKKLKEAKRKGSINIGEWGIEPPNTVDGSIFVWVETDEPKNMMYWLEELENPYVERIDSTAHDGHYDWKADHYTKPCATAEFKIC